ERRQQERNGLRGVRSVLAAKPRRIVQHAFGGGARLNRAHGDSSQVRFQWWNCIWFSPNGPRCLPPAVGTRLSGKAHHMPGPVTNQHAHTRLAHADWLTLRRYAATGMKGGAPTVAQRYPPR